MNDRNMVQLEGMIVGDVTYKTASNKKQYCSFTVHTETRESSGIVVANICVFVFDEKQMEYLKRVNAREGHRVSLTAHIRITKKELRSETILQTLITVSEVRLIKVS